MKSGFTIEYLKQQKAAGKIRDYKVNNPKPIPQRVQKEQKKKSKYGNEKHEVDGIEFDSKREAHRYGELKMLLKAGKIGLLDLQVPFELKVEGKTVCKYIADFCYTDAKTGEYIVEDVKSKMTRKLAVYRLKKKLMMQIHNIEIKEV